MDVHTIHICPFFIPHTTKETNKMPDEPTGTPPTEQAGQEPVIQEPVESPTLPNETPPAEPTPEMTPEEKRDHDMRSWIGRRDAELRQEIERNNQALLEKISTIFPQGQNVQAEPPMEAPDPAQDADAWLEHKLQEKVKAENQYNNTLIRTGTAIVQQDELVKADETLANEIYEEVKSGRVQINRMLPPETAAAVVVAQAKANVLSRRVLQKPNPLAGNTPNTAPVGSVQPPAAPAAPTPKIPKLTPLASKAAKRWGFTDDELADTFKDETST